MSNDLVVGSIRSTANPPLTGGIYEALLEKAERERDQWKEESLEQARLLGISGNREARLITERDNMQDQRDLAMRMAKEREKERDHYKAGLEEISKTIDDWLNSLVQEPAEDFIRAIKAWADKKLKEI